MLVCVATLFSIGTRLASLLGYQKFLGEDDFSADFIDEGKALMKRGLCENIHWFNDLLSYSKHNSHARFFPYSMCTV